MGKRVSKPEAKIAMMRFINRENDFRHSDYDKDMKQYVLMKNGDPEAVEESHRMMAENTVKLADHPLTNIKYLFICNITLMTRFAIEGGLDSEKAYTASDMYIQNLAGCDTKEEVLELHKEMVSYFTNQMIELKKKNIFSKQILTAMNYIDQHLHETLRITDVAEYVQLNSSYLSTLFKKETGLAFSEYVLRRKLEVAENMLCYSDYSCADISSYLAFSTQSYFNLVFKKKNGMTPAEFRKVYWNHHIKAAEKADLG